MEKNNLSNIGYKSNILLSDSADILFCEIAVKVSKHIFLTSVIT